MVQRKSKARKGSKTAKEFQREFARAPAMAVDAIALVEQLSLYWIAEGRSAAEPGSSKEAFDLLIKYGYTLNSTRTLLYRPDGSEVRRG